MSDAEVAKQEEEERDDEELAWTPGVNDSACYGRSEIDSDCERSERFMGEIKAERTYCSRSDR